MKASGRLAIAASVAFTLIAIFASGYFYGSRKASIELANLEGQVRQQSVHAETLLVDLTKERDKKQAALDQRARQQEETDNAAKIEIARLTDELANRPIRVRVVPESGACSGSATSDQASSATDSAGNAISTSGLLPESNSRRLRAAIAEVETLSAAYSSCRKGFLSNDI